MPKKLKQFLLRYDPPGIGLQVAEGDDLSVAHKDLPPAAQIRGPEDIVAEVDRIIDGDELLTRKRHKPALIQLLARLYQMEVDLDAVAEAIPVSDPDPWDKEAKVAGKVEDSPKGKLSSPKAASPLEPSPALQEGRSVVLIGLGADLSVHNGELGVLIKCRHDKKKYEVTLKNGQEVKVKGAEHIVPTASKAVPMVVGAMVVIRGLRNHTELNGCLGRVVECHEETHRFEVRATESGQLFRVKQENLVPIDSAFIPVTVAKENREPNTQVSPRGLRKDATGAASSSGINDSAASIAAGGEDDVFEQGSLVELQGLQTAKAYNGQQAEVLSVDRARQRYEIKLNDGSVKTIRAENVRLISRPSKTSPRNPRRKEGATKAADRGK